MTKTFDALNEKCGGPSSQKEKCPNCGKERMVHRLGSWDWKPKKCTSCQVDSFTKDMRKKLREIDE